MIRWTWNTARLVAIALGCTLLPSVAFASLPSVGDVVHARDESLDAQLLAADIERELPEPCVGPFCADAPQPKTRVRGFELGVHCRVGGEASLSCAPRRVWSERYDGRASDRLVYAKARYFDPQFGRFLSQDDYLGQIDNPPSLHRYFYANDNPTRFTDPTGHGVVDALQDVYSGVVSAGQEINRRYEEAVQARTIHGLGPDAVPFGLGPVEVGGEMIRRLDPSAGMPASVQGTTFGRMQAASNAFTFDAIANAMQMPADMFRSTTNLAVPGGFASWDGEGNENTEYAPLRKGQIENLKIAGDPSRAWYTRGLAGAGAVLSVPVTIAEGMTTAPGSRASAGVGTHLGKASTAATGTDAALEAIQAGGDFATAFAIWGSMAEPFLPGPKIAGAPSTSSKGPYRGGPHSETRLPIGDQLDSHHMPAKSVSPLDPAAGPAIQMEPAHHKLTSSYGGTPEAFAYRAEVKELLEQGRWRDAMAMEIRDVRRVAGTKYNEATTEMLDYARNLGLLEKK